MTSAALEGLNPLSPQARELRRYFFANAMEAELDGAGRIMLPARFMEAAGLSVAARWSSPAPASAWSCGTAGPGSPTTPT